MKASPDRDLLVLLKNEFISQQALEQQVEYLNAILLQTELPREFCKAHELIQRNRITQKPKKILATLHAVQLKPFWFFIGKN